MSFPLTLDEMPIAQLVEEIMKRKARADVGRCPYCNQPLRPDGGKIKCVCRFGETITNHQYFNNEALNPLR